MMSPEEMKILADAIREKHPEGTPEHLAGDCIAYLLKEMDYVQFVLHYRALDTEMNQ